MDTGGDGAERERDRSIPHKERKTMSFRDREEVKKMRKGGTKRRGRDSSFPKTRTGMKWRRH